MIVRLMGEGQLELPDDALEHLNALDRTAELAVDAGDQSAFTTALLALHDAGYRSIGCIPCTRPTREDEEERAGRWAGSDKLECGIHTDTTLERTR